MFETVSLITRTGYGTDDFSRRPTLMIFIGFVGGCAGSTAGGVKVIRIILLVQQALQELQTLVHPRRVRPVMLVGRVVKGGVV